MRKALKRGLIEQWDTALDTRLALCPTSLVRVLNDRGVRRGRRRRRAAPDTSLVTGRESAVLQRESDLVGRAPRRRSTGRLRS